MKFLLSGLAVLLLPAAVASAGELEVLRGRCAEQERQIRDLETEVARLRSQLERYSTEESGTPAGGSLLDLGPADGMGATGKTHTVAQGETLSRIAGNYGTTSEAIAALNSISDPSRLQIGMNLRIPAAASGPKTESTASEPAPPVNPDEVHVVKQGDTFYSIARIHGTSIDALLAANPGLDPARLRIGQHVILSGGASTTTTTPEPAGPPQVPEPDPSDPPAPPTPEPPQSQTTAEEPAVRLVTIDKQITFGDFAANHGATIVQLNELNGQTLNASTLLAEDSVLYVPITR